MDRELEEYLRDFKREIHDIPFDLGDNKCVILNVDLEGYFGLFVSNSKSEQILHYLSVKKLKGIKYYVTDNPNHMKEFFMKKLGVLITSRKKSRNTTKCTEFSVALAIFEDAFRSIPETKENPKKRKRLSDSNDLSFEESDDESFVPKRKKLTEIVKDDYSETQIIDSPRFYVGKYSIPNDFSSRRSLSGEVILGNAFSEITKQNSDVAPKVKFCGLCGEKRILETHKFCCYCGEQYV